MVARQKSSLIRISLIICLSACISLAPKNATAGFYLEKASFSYAIFDTHATSITLEVHQDFPPTFQPVTDITIDDGVEAISFEVDEIQPLITHEMPPGRKHVTVTSGGLVKLEGVIAGLYVDRIMFNAPAEKVIPSLDRVLIYSDSLALGGEVDIASREAWPILLREQFVVSLEAYGYRTLFDDASALADRKNFVSGVRLFSPDYIWMAIGTNDYAFGVWAPQDFGSAYALLLDALHEALPGAIIFAQSPIRRVNESIEVSGYTLEDFRKEIEYACKSRMEWCMFVDGTDSLFPQLDELANDGVHLTKTSNIKYADAVAQIIAVR